MRISDWSSDVCSSDLDGTPAGTAGRRHGAFGAQLSAARPTTGGHAHRGRVSALIGFGAPAPALHSRGTAAWFHAGRNLGNHPLHPAAAYTLPACAGHHPAQAPRHPPTTGPAARPSDRKTELFGKRSTVS